MLLKSLKWLQKLPNQPGNQAKAENEMRTAKGQYYAGLYAETDAVEPEDKFVNFPESVVDVNTELGNSLH